MPPLVSLSCQILPADTSTSYPRPRRQRRARSCTLQTSRHSAWSTCDSVVCKVFFFFFNRTWRFGEIFSERVGVSQQNGAKLQRAARVIFIPLLSCNQQSAITLILTDHARNLSLSYQFLSLPLRRAGTHTFPGLFFFFSSSISEQRRAECD